MAGASKGLARVTVFHFWAGLGSGPVLELLWRLAQAWPGLVLHVPGLLLAVRVLEIDCPLFVAFPQKLLVQSQEASLCLEDNQKKSRILSL